MMMNRTPQEIEALRRKALQLEFRVKADPEYLRQVKADPVAALKEAGFEDALAREFGAELSSDAKTSSAEKRSRWNDDDEMRRPEICDGITCWITTCNFWTGF